MLRRLRAFRPPTLAVLVIVFALVVGVSQHLQSPSGVFLFTPRNWCEPRSHAFTVGYLAVLVLAGLAWAGVFCVQWLAHGAGGCALKSRPAVLACVAFVLAGLASPLFEFALPMAVDARCVTRPAG